MLALGIFKMSQFALNFVSKERDLKRLKKEEHTKMLESMINIKMRLIR